MKIKDCSLREVLSCDGNKAIVEVAKNLKDKKNNHIIITEKGNPQGIISTTDISNRVVAEKKRFEKNKGKGYYDDTNYLNGYK
jgi:predicted transcriptional regulator